MKVASKTRNLQISPRKLRLVANLIRGMQVTQAKHLLVSTNKKAANLVYDGLASAIANAQNNNNLRLGHLAVDEIRVDEGSRLKRYKPRAKGVAGKIIHRRSHLTIVVSDQKKESDKDKSKKIATDRTRTKSKLKSKESK